MSEQCIDRHGSKQEGCSAGHPCVAGIFACWTKQVQAQAEPLRDSHTHWHWLCLSIWAFLSLHTLYWQTKAWRLRWDIWSPGTALLSWTMHFKKQDPGTSSIHQNTSSSQMSVENCCTSVIWESKTQRRHRYFIQNKWAEEQNRSSEQSTLKRHFLHLNLCSLIALR